MRALLRDILQDEGYTVNEARDGQVALDLLQTTNCWVVHRPFDAAPERPRAPLAAVVADSQLHARHEVIC